MVLRAIDLKEKDKLITIFTPERGIVSAALRGVRQLKSKLKFAAQPMCFAEFCLTGSGDILTCTGASEIESFFVITQDYDKMIYASAMLEMIYTTAFKEPNLELFVSLVRGLGKLCDENVDAGIVFIKYSLNFFKFMGYGISFDSCKTCGQKFDDDVCLDLDMGAIICSGHAGFNSINISKSCFKLLGMINSFEYDKLSNLKANQNQIKPLINLMVCNFNSLFDKRLKSIKV